MHVLHSVVKFRLSRILFIQVQIVSRSLFFSNIIVSIDWGVGQEGVLLFLNFRIPVRLVSIDKQDSFLLEDKQSLSQDGEMIKLCTSYRYFKVLGSQSCNKYFFICRLLFIYNAVSVPFACTEKQLPVLLRHSRRLAAGGLITKFIVEALQG